LARRTQASQSAEKFPFQLSWKFGIARRGQAAEAAGTEGNLRHAGVQFRRALLAIA
jgi:hypothetical protein